MNCGWHGNQIRTHRWLTLGRHHCGPSTISTTTTASTATEAALGHYSHWRRTGWHRWEEVLLQVGTVVMLREELVSVVDHLPYTLEEMIPVIRRLAGGGVRGRHRRRQTASGSHCPPKLHNQGASIQGGSL